MTPVLIYFLICLLIHLDLAINGTDLKILYILSFFLFQFRENRYVYMQMYSFYCKLL